MNDGLHYYQRKYPVALHGWCKAVGKGFVYKKRLEIPSEATQTQIVLAVEKQNEIFEDHVSVIRGGNTPKLTEFELRKKAKALLQHQGLAEGMLNAKATDQDERVLQELGGMLLDRYFDDAVHYDNVSEYEIKMAKDDTAYYKALQKKEERDKAMPLQIQVQNTAWRLLHEEPEQQPELLFSHAWELYEKERRYTGIDQASKRNFERMERDWKNFMLVVGERPLTQNELDKAFRIYYEYLKTTQIEAGAYKGELRSAESIRRRLVAPTSAINSLIEIHNLGSSLSINKPRTKSSKSAKPKKERAVLTHEQQRAFISLIRNQQHRRYKPWVELSGLIMIQTGAINSEIMRMLDTALVMDHEVPYVVFSPEHNSEGAFKTEQRVRVVPLVVQPDRIRILVNELKDESGRAIGKYASSLSESSFSLHMTKILREVHEDATAYSLRHSGKYNCEVAGVSDSVTHSVFGWSGARALSEMTKYAKDSVFETERLKSVADTLKIVNAHLLTEHDPADVIQFRRS